MNDLGIFMEKDFINKLKIVEEEADESSYFLDVLKEIDKGKNKEKYINIKINR